MQRLRLSAYLVRRSMQITPIYSAGQKMLSIKLIQGDPNSAVPREKEAREEATSPK